MNQTFTIPYIDRAVEWNNDDVTFIVGANCTGKTLLIHEMMKWCGKKGYNCIHYDAIEALYEFDNYVHSSSDDDIVLTLRIMSAVFLDFKDDIAAWAKRKNGHTYDQIGDYMEDVDLLRYVLSMCGNGYSRLFVMIMKAIRKPHANFYFLDLPETSLHFHVSKILSDFLMGNFEYMKFVIATHSPEMVGFSYESKNFINLS